MKAISENALGAAFMAASMAGFALNDMMMKLSSADLSLFQAIFLRGLFVTTFIGLLAWHKKVLFARVARHDLGIMALRLIGEIGGTMCFLMALFNMPMANATAILQALPLAITLVSAVFLGETVGWRRYSAIALGFIGVLIVIRPGSEGFNEYSIWALAAVVFIVLRDLSTRKLSAQMPSLQVGFTTAAGITLAAAVLLPAMEWRPVAGDHILRLGIAAVFLMGAYLFSIKTMRIGDIAVVSPFRYTGLIWSILIGLVVFGDPLDQWTLIGSAFIVVMGIYTFYREQKKQKRVTNN